MSLSPFMRARLSIAVLFTTNGMTAGSWSAKIPEITETLDITKAQLGILILFFGIGAMATLPFVGKLSQRFGNTGLIRISSLAATVVIFAFTLAPSYAVALIVSTLVGLIVTIMDIAININVGTIEKTFQKPIMSSSHGFWSLGAMFGALVGGVIIETFGPMTHALGVGAIMMALTLPAIANIYPDPTHSSGRAPPQKASFNLEILRHPLVIVLGIYTLIAMLIEGSILDWGALYLSQDLSARLSIATLAYASCSLSMTIMRLSGDTLRERLGSKRFLMGSVIVGSIGLTLVGLASHWLVALLGFFVVGMGIANIIPILFASANRLSHVNPAKALSAIVGISYVGVLSAPGLIGMIAPITGLDWVYLGLAALLLIVVTAGSLKVINQGESQQDRPHLQRCLTPTTVTSPTHWPNRSTPLRRSNSGR